MAESNQYDIVFIIDESGSMQEYIDKVKNNVTSFVNTLKSNGVDVQLGLVEYGDGTLSIKKHELTDNVDAFIANLNAISAWGGGENGLTAIMDPTNGAISLNFREGSNKEFIVVTDEGYIENDSDYSRYSGSKYTETDVTTDLKNKGIKLDVFGAKREAYLNSGKASNDYYNATYFGEGWCESEWTSIANATTGKLINGVEAQGQFYDIESNFLDLMTDTVLPTKGGTHQLAFAQWSYGFTPNSENNTSDTPPIIAPSA